MFKEIKFEGDDYIIVDTDFSIRITNEEYVHIYGSSLLSSMIFIYHIKNLDVGKNFAIYICKGDENDIAVYYKIVCLAIKEAHFLSEEEKNKIKKSVDDNLNKLLLLQ